MLDNALLAQEFVSGMSVAQFERDLKTQYAAVRALEIISEASRRLSPAVIERYPATPWHDLRAAGNVYRHDYDEVLPGRIWDTLQENLPPLIEMLRGELGRGD